MTSDDLEGLLQLLHINTYSKRIQDVLKPKVRSHLVYFIRHQLGLGEVRLAPGYWKTYWPPYTKKWLLENWDGDWTPPKLPLLSETVVLEDSDEDAEWENEELEDEVEESIVVRPPPAATNRLLTIPLRISTTLYCKKSCTARLTQNT